MNQKLAQQIGREMKQVRLARHLSQKEVAEKANISVNHYARIERGEVRIYLETLERIVKALRIKSGDIISF